MEIQFVEYDSCLAALDEFAPIHIYSCIRVHAMGYGLTRKQAESDDESSLLRMASSIFQPGFVISRCITVRPFSRCKTRERSVRCMYTFPLSPFVIVPHLYTRYPSGLYKRIQQPLFRFRSRFPTQCNDEYCKFSVREVYSSIFAIGYLLCYIQQPPHSLRNILYIPFTFFSSIFAKMIITPRSCTMYSYIVLNAALVRVYELCTSVVYIYIAIVTSL